MKQLIQSIADGKIELIDVPEPNIADNEILIKSSISLISSGTERMIHEFSKSSFLDKGLKQPERVRDVINKAKTDGLFETFDAVRNKINNPIPLGYSNVGIVVNKGKNVKDFAIGDRVICNGSHSELNAISNNLCAKIPENVKDEDAAFTVLAAIALQGIRLANPTLGETFLVSGLGLIGLLTCQLLQINGCKVFGVDPDQNKIKIAESLGIESCSQIEDVLSWCKKNNNGNLCDGVIISASTNSNQPIEIASKITRKRGRIVLIGDVGLKLNRDLFYKKELSFQVSCSYGSGRYEYGYEKLSQNYPLGYVRWTVKTNFEAILNLISNNKLKLNPLISKKFDFYNSEKAYELLIKEKSLLGILLKYSFDSLNNANPIKSVKIESNNQEIISTKNDNKVIINLIGVGNYASRVLIPNLKKSNVILNEIISNKGLSPKIIGRKYGFKIATTDIEKTLIKKNYNSLVICTRHNSHASLVLKGLENNKHIYVEKPLCLNSKELQNIKEKKISNKILMVGFNRRFSKLTQILHKELGKINDSKLFIYTCNAGRIDEAHWTQNPDIGGGRLIGEACHFVDLIKYLSRSKIVNLKILKGIQDNNYTDNFTLHIQFKDNSTGIINYTSKGNKSFPKENLKVFSENKIFVLDNFIKLKAWGVKRFQNIRLMKQDKGHKECLLKFKEAIEKSLPSPIDFDDIYQVHYWLLKELGR